MIDKNLLKELQPYKYKVVMIILCDVVSALVIAVRCYCLASVIDKMLFSRLSREAAVPQLALLLFLFSLEAAANLVIRFTAHNISLDIRKKIRGAFIKKLACSSPMSSIYDVNILQMVTKGVDSFEPYFSKFLPQLSLTAILPIVILITAFYNDWISGLIFLFTLPLIPFFMVLIGKRAQSENNRQWAALAHLSELFSELLAGMAVIKIYNQGKRQLEKTVWAGERFSQAVLKVLRIAFLSAFFLELIATLSIAVIAVNIGLRLLYGQADFLPVFFILLLAPEFYKPLRQTGSMFHDAMGAITNAGEIFAAIEEKNAAAGKTMINLTEAPQIKFSSVGYQYNSQRENALKKIDLNFAAGKVTAIVGRSGAGKSTVFSLLLKYISPISGKILIDGVDITTLDERAWRSNIAYVPQQAHIFNATLRENICMGKTISDEKIKNIIKLAGLQELTDVMPNGLETLVGAGARGLSCGQARRVAIARALLVESSVVMLDEPMEGLDIMTEKAVWAGIKEMVKSRTVIIIAHRLSSIKNADMIYVMDSGAVSECGTDASLRAEGGIYCKMLEAVSGGGLA
ncbi:thiol reductant ABC exporter subunit CydD [Pectinatus haikarae]|uniref:thiol reductant ABC exporter subunit CydD n=1 Tax=Pectinatus haikarae TaxID=349096 RepID=UPI0018C77505|nr:thiol reductant ABC exporter subunit CydD [Pectinatus haikarae]